MNISPELRNAIEGLYGAFASYLLPPDTGACPCCHHPQEELLLHRRALRELGFREFGKYPADALLVWGNLDTLRHLLPRIFELLALSPRFPFDFGSPEIVLARLYEGGWWEWPEYEQLAVRDYLHCLWKDVLLRQSDEDPNVPVPGGYFAEIESWICGIAQAEPDLSSYLENWRDAGEYAPAVHLALLISCTDILKSTAPNAFWTNAPEQFEQLRRWIQSEDIKRKVAGAAKSWPDSSILECAAVLLT
jgi:hypothetical protein